MVCTETYILSKTHFLSLSNNIPPKNTELNVRFYEHGWLPLLKRCKSMEEFKQVHAHILKLGLFWDHFCGSNLVATCALAKWGSMEYACSIFRRIEEPSSFEYNTMIRGNVNCMNLEEALILYIEMLKEGIEPDNFTYPFVFKACSLLGALKEGMQIYSHVFKAGLEGDLFVQNSLISMYGKCGAIEHARDVFDKMSERSVASWSAVIGAHASAEMWHECLKLFNDMMHDGRYRPEESTLVSVLSACTHLGSPNLGSSVHGILLRNTTELNVIVKTSLIDMYAKCGCIEKGLCVFHSMAEKNKHSYTVMISGLAVHGRGSEALRIFAEMLEQGLAPDDVVYVGVLSACTHAGLVNEGLEFFNRMQFEHKIDPTIQHYGCMVDLMGRAGMLREAYELIKSMPRKPNDVLWRSLLNACKVQHNLELGEIAAENIFMLNPHNPGDYLVLANMYARAQKWVDMAKIRTEMVRKGLVQTPGFSLVEVKRRVYKFVSHDKSQPHFHSIYAMIHQMEWQLKFEGYIPDTSQVLLDVDEEEKRQRLKYHSQKLAIAFALIHTSEGSPIRIFRNLRMCNDCHTYTKFISMIYEREITVRDRNLFHHFKDGACSCKDYW
ncbi:pentatricopeptide repeat-containing protein At1g31920 isoform X1 [Arachis ipaensis]|uniref:pentatricopeptide repeat-containing protein At1g31920 isoform X1 n=2 Tax=Arachis ipaensis TaxID=130454 RepID=UPI0007AFB254|nr:pentatricopeptide repeat-containing protein At1g31920 isoform X1 [Arachis ipaensis]